MAEHDGPSTLTARFAASMARLDVADARPGADLGPVVDALPGPLGVAVSGGSDSMALLDLATGWAGAPGIRAVTVDHRLRPESADEAAWVARFCAGRALLHQTVVLAPLPATGNPSENARIARYDALGAWAAGQGVTKILLGHTADDQAETVLMRLARGAGVEGLAGIAPVRWLDGVALLRPVLAERRATLQEHLRARQIAWIDDPTNEDLRYDRVRARRALATLAPLGITVEGLGKTARQMARQRMTLSAAADALAARALRHGPHGEVWLDCAALRAADRDTALRVLARALGVVGGGRHRPRLKALERALGALLTDGPDQTLAGCLLGRAGEAALILREPAAMAVAGPVAEGAGWDGRWHLAGAGTARLWIAAAADDLVSDALRATRAMAPDLDQAFDALDARLRRTVPVLMTGSGDCAAVVAVPTLGWAKSGYEALQLTPTVRDEALDWQPGAG